MRNLDLALSKSHITSSKNIIHLGLFSFSVVQPQFGISFPYAELNFYSENKRDSNLFQNR